MALGDCYFLETCSEVANTTSRIKTAFLTQTYNAAAGIIAASVYVKGIEVLVYIDDFFPNNPGSGNFAFA